MKYTSEIVIDMPRERVVAFFETPAKMDQWQPGLESREHLEGDPG